ncbi:MAG: phospholipid carrier-dependent glycosyltransferase [Nodosilinea sp.]
MWWGSLAIGALALTLRFWHLGQPPTLVFDEVYYVPFALDYLQGNPSFDAHPPLGKYLIALGIWLGQWPVAWLGWPMVDVEGAWVSPLAFRWLNAVVGATIPLLLATLAWELGSLHHGLRGDRFSAIVEDPPKSPLKRGTLTRLITPLFKGGRGDPLTLRQHRFALLAGLLMTMEGLSLVESRLALINIYGLVLGLLGQWAWIRAGRSQHSSRWRWVAGIALGAAINVKWNWAGLWLGLLLWEIGFCQRSNAIASANQPNPVGANGYSPSQPAAMPTELEDTDSASPVRFGDSGRANDRLPLRMDLTWRRRVAYLGVMPLATYLLLWLPHLALTGESLGGVHQQLWSAHQSIGVNGSHAYCSPWQSWPLMLRPVAYFFERVGQGENAIATTIHAMGNPVLWWLSTAAMLALALGWLSRQLSVGAQHAAPLPNRAVVPFILINYLTNWLPWALVSRCTFFYHAMGIATFGTLGLAWLMAQWVENSRDRPLALVLLGAIALSFWFWLPLYLGLPLTPESLQQRWLLPGWI